MTYDYIKCGDNVTLMKDLPDECIDLTVTSPPYDNLRNYNGYTWDFESVAKELYRITKQGGTVVWIVADATVNGSETCTSFKQALFFKDVGFRLSDTMIWSKPGFTSVGAIQVRYAQTFEYMFVFTKGKTKTFNPIKDRVNISAGGKLYGTLRHRDGLTRPVSGIGKVFQEYGIRFNVWQQNTVVRKSERVGHPAPFPVQLAKDHIISWSNENDIVLDPFVGSGTTCVASKELNRHYIGFDISQEYIDIANKRINDTVYQYSL